MPISFDLSAAVQWIVSPRGGDEYPRQVVIDLGLIDGRYCLEMRDLIHWTAYRLDTGGGGAINHRTAVLLRSIAEQFYPYGEDEADYIIEDLREEGCVDDLEYEDPATPPVDPRLLGLTDGMVHVSETFDEVLWSDQAPHPILRRNAAETVDFLFPTVVAEAFGIKGIRVCVLDLLSWLIEHANREALSFENEDAWLTELEISRLRKTAAVSRYQSQRLRGQVEKASNGGERAIKREALSDAQKDQALAELASIIG